MNRFLLAPILVLISPLVLPILIAHAQPLRLAQVSAPAINCFYGPDCRVSIEDFTRDVAITAERHAPLLQIRWFAGQFPAPLGGLFGYQYRVHSPIDYPDRCIEALHIDFPGDIVAIDYLGNGTNADVYVIASGGLGAVAPVRAHRLGTTITFYFDAPFVCSGRGSFFFGLTSPQASAFPLEMSVAQTRLP